VLEVFRRLPKDRILLETDAPDMIPPEDFVKFSLGAGVNHPANLRRIAEAFGRETRDGMLGRIEGNGWEFWH
jgi:Tat protein secretion system quality control protein TatD with DNase activity